MRLTWKDAAAAVLVAAIVVPYVGYLTRGSMPFIHDARGMAGTALVLGAVACYAGDMRILARRWNVVAAVAAVLGIAALGLGIAALVTESGGLLAAFIITIVALWMLATLRHAGFKLPAGRAPTAGAVRH